jgi:iron complex transport system permease protein
MLVLSGVIVSGIMTSIQGCCKYLADPYDQLQSIVFWTMGSMSSIHMSDIVIVIVPMVIAGAVLIVLRWRLNVLTLGESEAKSLGVSIVKMNRIAILCSTILTACAVCLCGTIGWIGLVVPHIARMLVGSDNRYLLPASLLAGAAFMVLVDSLARCMTSSEIPLSILTGIIGGPIFIAIMARKGLGSN